MCKSQGTNIFFQWASNQIAQKKCLLSKKLKIPYYERSYG